MPETVGSTAKLHRSLCLTQQVCLATGQLIFVASYFDYVRLRNHLRAEAADAFVGVCEYTEHPEAARRRTYFRQARACGGTQLTRAAMIVARK